MAGQGRAGGTRREGQAGARSRAEQQKQTSAADDKSGTPAPLGPPPLAQQLLKRRTSQQKALASFTAMWPSPPSPITPTLTPGLSCGGGGGVPPPMHQQAAAPGQRNPCRRAALHWLAQAAAGRSSSADRSTAERTHQPKVAQGRVCGDAGAQQRRGSIHGQAVWQVQHKPAGAGGKAAQPRAADWPPAGGSTWAGGPASPAQAHALAALACCPPPHAALAFVRAGQPTFRSRRCAWSSRPG